jgi:hypothetical protein
MPPWQRASRTSSPDNSDLYAPPTPRARSPRVRFSNRIRPACGVPPQTQRATLASRDATERSTASRSFSRPGRAESPHMTPAVFGQQEKPLRHIILGVDIGFKMTKIAVASYLDGDDSASISRMRLQTSTFLGHHPNFWDDKYQHKACIRLQTSKHMKIRPLDRQQCCMASKHSMRGRCTVGEQVLPPTSASRMLPGDHSRPT